MENITIGGKTYEATTEASPHNCSGCAFEESNGDCGVPSLRNSLDCAFKKVIFKESISNCINQAKPTLQMNLELDLSGCILPVFFKVKGLKVHSLDAAIAKGTSDYNISVGDIPQESLESVAEALKAEFLKRNTKG